MKIPTSPERMDILDMRRRLGNDEGLIAELLTLFLDDYRGQLAALEVAINARRHDDIRRYAHALKGSAGIVSAFGVTETAAALEELAERSDVANLDHQFATLVFEIDQLVAELCGPSSKRL